MGTQRMNNADAAWLHMDRPTNLMVVNSVLWFEEPLDVARAKEILRVRLVERFPRFSQRIAEPRFGVGVPSWEDDPNFDLERHVHHIALAPPGDKAALEALVGDLMVTPLDRSKPLWDTYLVDGYNGGMAMVWRIHHCIADGIALSRLLLSLTDAEADAGIAPATGSAVEHRLLESITAPVKAGVHIARAGVHEGIEILGDPTAELTSLANSGTVEARTLAKVLLTGSDTKTVFTGRPGVARTVTWSERMALDQIKEIGHRTDTTVNDVLVASLTGALRCYLEGRDSVVPEIRAMVPFNLRPLQEPLPRELGNRFGLVYLTLPVGTVDPMERLMEVHRRMDAIKHTPEGVLSYGVLNVIGLTPPEIEQRLLDVFGKKTTAVMTNVAGPRGPLHLAGTKLAGVIAWVPAAGTIGMGMSIFSYDGGVTVGFQVDPGLVPDPEAIISAYEHEVSALRNLTQPKKRRARAKRPAPSLQPPAAV